MRQNVHVCNGSDVSMANINDVVEIVVVSMRDAFLAVTVFVAAMVLNSVGCNMQRVAVLSNIFERRKNCNP